MVGQLIVLSVPGDVAYFMTSIICKFSENDLVPPQAPKSRNASHFRKDFQMLLAVYIGHV